jgi:hypothetical protein
MVAVLFNCEGNDPSRQYSPLSDNSENPNLYITIFVQRIFDEHRQEDRSDAVTIRHLEA